MPIMTRPAGTTGSHMVRKSAPTCALCAVMSLLSACGAASDTPTGPSSAVVTPPAPTTGIVQGIVKREAYAGLVFYPEGPLSGAQVLVTEGAGAGQSVTTGADGAYRFELPPGPFRVRWSAQGYEPRDGDPGAVIAGSTTTVNTVTLRLSFESNPEWSISGIVRDGLGNPVAGAQVDAGDGVSWTVALTSTDAAGRFQIASRRAHPDWLHISAWKEGYRARYMTVLCGSSCALTADLRVLRRVREWLDGPSTMQVGDIATVSLVDDYDDGTRSVVPASVNSSNLAVLQVLPSQPPYDKTYVKAIAPGAATLQLPFANQTLILNVHVVP